MGWTGTYTYEKNAYRAMKTEFEDYIARNELDAHATSMVRVNGRGHGYQYVGYAVVSDKPSSPCYARTQGRKFALIVLLGFSAKESEVYYKDMDETVLPCECGMSARMVGMLDETDNESAKQWRVNCLKQSERTNRERRIRRALSDAADGTRVKWVVSVDCDTLPAKGTEVTLATRRYYTSQGKRRTGLVINGQTYSTKGLPLDEFEVLA